MLTQTSPVIIDWVTATQGNPLGDVVWTRLLLELDNLAAGAPNKEAIDAIRPMLYEGYRNGYSEVRDVDNEALPMTLNVQGQLIIDTHLYLVLLYTSTK